MKILKIFAIVVGIHVFALVLIFANPGCSSTTKPAPAPTDTVVQSPAAPPITVPTSSGAYASGANPAPSSPPITFNPDAPAVAPSSSSSVTSGLRVAPTRPGTPVAGVLVAEPVIDVTPATTYAVRPGDSLWSVAKKHHLTLAELTTANSLPSNATLRPGQKLVIPGKPASPAAAATATGGASATPKATEVAPAAAARAAGEVVKHTVKSGETLGAIARFYGVRAADIAVANNISDPAKIKAGDQLTIPGWQTPKGGKAAKSGAGGKSPATKSAPAAEPAEATPPPATPPPVPIIRIDESPVTPAPKP